MGAAGVFAFAPLSNTPIVAGGLNASANTENQTFDLGLRPDTDPVVYVTESGLEIKKSNGKYTSTTTTTTNNGKSYTQDLTSFYYFTMGTFSGRIYTAKTVSDTYEVSNEPVNWLIIGRGSGFEFNDNTPAGTSIKTDNSKQEFAIAPGGYLPMDMQSIPEGPDNEIPDNCFLVLSEKLLGSSCFNGSGTLFLINDEGHGANFLRAPNNHGTRYRFIGNSNTENNGSQSWNTTSNAGGTLYNAVNALFSKNNSTGKIVSNNLGFTQTQADLVIPQQLYTYYSNGRGYNYAETPSTDGGTYYTMFPLAARYAYSSTKQNFCIEDYLPSTSQRVATLIGSNQSYYWFFRSGHPNGQYHCGTAPQADLSYGCADNYMGIRPAFVLRVMG